MKLNNIIVSTFALASAISAAPYNGFYAGVSAGSEARVTQYNDQNNSQNNEYIKYNVNMIGSMYVGYLKELHNSLCLGGEFSLTLPASNKEFKLYDQLSAQSAKVKYKRSLGFKFAPRIGHIINKTNFLYATLGFEGSKDSVTYKDSTGNIRTSKSFNAWSFNPGFGFEHTMNKWILGMEYVYSIGKKASFSQVNTSNTLQIQRRSHQLMFRLAYGF